MPVSAGGLQVAAMITGINPTINAMHIDQIL